MAPTDSPATPALQDGRYEGANEHLTIDLRLDAGGTDAVSADLYRHGPGDRKDWVASVRSAPGKGIGAAPGPWPMIAEDDIGGHTTGRLHLTSSNGSEDALRAVLVLDAPLNGLPARTEIAVDASHQDTTLRSLKIEVETEEGVAAPVAYGEVTIESCLEAAGFEVGPAGAESTILAAPDGGWEVAQLHTLMQDFAQASLSARAWELHLLLLSRATKEGLLGVMFDMTEVLPRQGAAVFAGSIRKFAGANADRELIQTSVHELGHALNLAHRFERVVGRGDSASFMNYDWHYRGGEKADEYWKDFAFTFDPDELSFLRHAPRSAVIPGGAAFHSVRYWNEGTGGYSPYVQEVPIDGVKLELRPPASGRLFSFAQPVFLEVRLTNLTDRALDLSPEVLDPKTGFLEILIRKTGGVSTRSLADAEPFNPIMQRCVREPLDSAQSVAPKESVANNVNLTYGSSGFAFAEPGAYEVTALLSFLHEEEERDYIVRSEPLPIRVAAPMQIEEEHDAMDLFRDDVGVYLALGGNRNLETAHDKLAAIAERRGGDPADPIVATILRAQALDATRGYVRKGVETGAAFSRQEAQPDRAVSLLGRLDDAALEAFDAVTAEGTRKLADTYER
jgi:hypothetical protein